MKRTYKIHTVTRDEPYRQSVWHWVGWDTPGPGWRLAYHGSFDSWQDAEDVRAELQAQEDAYQQFLDEISVICARHVMRPPLRDYQKDALMRELKELFDFCPMEAKRYEDEQSGSYPDCCAYSRYIEGRSDE